MSSLTAGVFVAPPSASFPLVVDVVDVVAVVVGFVMAEEEDGEGRGVELGFGTGVDGVDGVVDVAPFGAVIYSQSFFFFLIFYTSVFFCCCVGSFLLIFFHGFRYFFV